MLSRDMRAPPLLCDGINPGSMLKTNAQKNPPKKKNQKKKKKTKNTQMDTAKKKKRQNTKNKYIWRMRIMGIGRGA